MAKKNFNGVPDDYATTLYPSWGKPEEAFFHLPSPEPSAHFAVHKDAKGNAHLNDLTGMLKDVYEGPLAPANPHTKAMSQMEYVEQLFGKGLITKQQQQAYNHIMHGVPYKPPVDPVLIKGSGYKAGPAFFDDIPTLPEPMAYSHMPKQIKIQTKIEIPGYSDGPSGYKVHGFGHAISEYSDITESQLRKMLMDGFLKITDDIINNMKEKMK